jgi:protein-disulfide isomerase
MKIMNTPDNAQHTVPNKDDVITLLILAIMVLQIILLAGLLFRINQVYTIIAGSNLSTVVVENIPINDAPFLGPVDAPVTIIEFSDYTCGYCRLIQETLTEVVEKYDGQVRIVFRDFPQGGQGSLAFNAALATRCSAEQKKFQEMRTLLFQNQPRFDSGRLIRYASSIELDLDDFEYCMNLETNWTKVQADYEDGVKYGVSATPTFFINGRILVGAAPISEFERLINLALQEQE